MDTVDRALLRREVIARLRDLPLPAPLTGQTFCAMLQALRRRPILIWPMPMIAIARRLGYDPAAVPSGLWLADDRADHILHEEHTRSAHRQRIIFHEGAHILWGDRPAQVLHGSFDAGLYRHLDLARMRTVMARSDYASSEEVRAELTATELQLRATGPRRPSRPVAMRPADAATAAALRRLLADFSGEGAR